jgi:hypothetical protein
MTDNGSKYCKFTKWDVPFLMKEAYEDTFTKKNIMASWKRAGLAPEIDVSVPLARIKRQGT